MNSRISENKEPERHRCFRRFCVSEPKFPLTSVAVERRLRTDSNSGNNNVEWVKYIFSRASGQQGSPLLVLMFKCTHSHCQSQALEASTSDYFTDTLTLEFRIRDSRITGTWIRTMIQCMFESGSRVLAKVLDDTIDMGPGATSQRVETSPKEIPKNSLNIRHRSLEDF